MHPFEQNTFSRITHTLHLNKTVHSGIDLAHQVRKGLPFMSVENVCAELGLSQQVLSKSIGLNIRTLNRRKKEKRLQADESDRIYRLVRIYAMAVEVLENKQHAIEWLTAPKIALNGNAPLSLLDTEAGAREVEQLLGRIEYNVLS